jgi:hypothetical protein
MQDSQPPAALKSRHAITNNLQRCKTSPSDKVYPIHPYTAGLQPSIGKQQPTTEIWPSENAKSSRPTYLPTSTSSRPLVS